MCKKTGILELGWVKILALYIYMCVYTYIYIYIILDNLPNIFEAQFLNLENGNSIYALQRDYKY